MAKELTRRQYQLLGQFLDAYQEVNEPIHYVALAKRLDLGKITVYEMLRLLEKRGLVKSEFHLPAVERGPGRAKILFQPTQEAIRLVEHLSEKQEDTEEWEIVKQRILRKLHEGKAAGYETLLDELVVRIPNRRTPLIFMTEMVTATILSVISIQKKVEDKGLIDRLRRIGRPGEIGLSTLEGISASLSMIEGIHLSISTFLLEQSSEYKIMLAQLSADKRKQLSAFAREVAKIATG